MGPGGGRRVRGHLVSEIETHEGGLGRLPYEEREWGLVMSMRNAKCEGCLALKQLGMFRCGEHR